MKKNLLFLLAFVMPLLVASCDDASRGKLRTVAGAVSAEIDRRQGNAGGDVADVPNNGGGDKLSAVDGIEIPAPMTGGSEIVLKRKGYTVSYNAATRQPNWVAWILTDKRTKGGNERKNYKFEPDADVPSPRAEDTDYRSSGYDRGHMCPAGDNKWNGEAMRQSFLFSNICPQAPGLNRGDWNEMEQACRRWAKAYGSLYVVCGPVFYKKTRRKTIGRNKVAVPDAFFKVLLCTEGTPKAIGFIYKNTDGDRPMGDYVNTVDEVERITGIDFFPSLPDKVEKKVEAECDLKQW